MKCKKNNTTLDPFLFEIYCSFWTKRKWVTQIVFSSSLSHHVYCHIIYYISSRHVFVHHRVSFITTSIIIASCISFITIVFHFIVRHAFQKNKTLVNIQETKKKIKKIKRNTYKPNHIFKELIFFHIFCAFSAGFLCQLSHDFPYWSLFAKPPNLWYLLENCRTFHFDVTMKNDQILIEWK